MKLCSLQTLVAVLATSTLVSGARSDSSRLPLQARDEQKSDSVSVTSSGEDLADGEYVILSDEGVEQASVVVHKGAVAATEEASLRKLYTWLGAYFARRDHASETPVLAPKTGVVYPQQAVVYKQVEPLYDHQAPTGYPHQAAYAPYNRAVVPGYGQAYGQTQRPFASHQSYRPKPQPVAYQYSNPGYNTNPGYNGSPGYNGNTGFSSPGYNSNPGYNGYPGYGANPYTAYSAYNAYPYAAYAYNTYLQNLRSAMANYGAQTAASYTGVPSLSVAPSSASAASSADESPSFNGFTSSLPVNADHEQKQGVHTLPGFASFPPDSLAALVSPLSAQPGGEGTNLQADFDAQQEKMQHELELQQKELEVQRKYHEEQVKLQKELEIKKKALEVQREYREQQEKLKAMHEAQEAAKGDAVESDVAEAVEYDEVEADDGRANKSKSKTYLYGTFREPADA